MCCVPLHLGSRNLQTSESDVATGAPKSEEPHQPPTFRNPRWLLRVPTVSESCSFSCLLANLCLICVSLNLSYTKFCPITVLVCVKCHVLCYYGLVLLASVHLVLWLPTMCYWKRNAVSFALCFLLFLSVGEFGLVAFLLSLVCFHLTGFSKFSFLSRWNIWFVVLVSHSAGSGDREGNPSFTYRQWSELQRLLASTYRHVCFKSVCGCGPVTEWSCLD